MDNNNLKLLSKGISDFIKIIESERIYVDKTDLIYKLARQTDYLFLNRPRRFGKTLLISTLETLFKYGVKYFDGLKIAKLWKDKTYKVLRLDFSSASDFHTIDEFLEFSWSVFDTAFHDGGFNFRAPKGASPAEIFREFSKTMDRLSLVLLIDEYDAPLSACLHIPELFESVRDYFSQFYRIIKQSDAIFRFVFLTGVSKFNKSSIFSGLNNLTDISWRKDYSTLLGYTEEDLLLYFGDYIEQAANVHNTTTELMIEQMREQYDGFRFSLKEASHVYNPWSVLNFFMSPAEGLQNYWYMTSGQPSILRNYLKGRDSFSASQYNKPKYITISELLSSNDCGSMKDEILLTHSGYLTIKKVSGDRITLGYPNKEVALSIAQLSLDYILINRAEINIDSESLLSLFSSNRPEKVVKRFNSIFSEIHYLQYPVSNEATCRAMLQLVLIVAGLAPIVERGNCKGRSDLEVSVGKLHWVFELKFLPWKKSAGGQETASSVSKRSPINASAISLLAGALSQIRERRYGEGCRPETRLIRMALVFSEQDRRFVEWQTYPLKRKKALKGREKILEEKNGLLAEKLARLGWTEKELDTLRN